MATFVQTAHDISNSAYRAVGSKEGWPGFLMEVSRAIGCSGCMAGFLEKNGDWVEYRGGGIAWLDVDAALLKKACLDLYSERRQPGVTTIVLERDVMVGTMLESLCKHAECPHVTCVMSERANETVFAFVLFAKVDMMPDSYWESLVIAMPHIASSFELYQKIAALERACSTYQIALNHSSVGVAVVGSDGRIEWMNRFAAYLCGRADALWVSEERLVAWDSQGQSQLEQAVGLALHDAEDTVTRSQPLIKLRSSIDSCTRPIEVFVQAIQTDSASSRGAIVFLADPNNIHEELGAKFAHLYGMTPTEAVIAQRLMAGRNTQSIATELGNSTATVRTHIKRILRKCEVHSQAELVSILHQGIAKII